MAARAKRPRSAIGVRARHRPFAVVWAL